MRVAPDRGLTVEVTDDGAGEVGPSTGTGLGIRGMRERAESTGGRARRRAPARRWLPRAGDVGRPVVIRVVLADDQPLVRAGFRMLLDAEDDIEVVGEADDGAARARAACAPCGPTSC